MPLFRKIKAKSRTNRGDGPDFFIKLFEENFSTWEENVGALSDDDKEKLQQEFDEIEDGLGEALCGTIEEFRMVKSDCSSEKLEAIANKLQEYFEVEAE